MTRRSWSRFPLFLALSVGFSAFAQDWSKGVVIGPNGRANPYNINENLLPDVIRAGRLEALNYPVDVTAIVLPYRPTKEFLDQQSQNPLRALLERLLAGFTRETSLDDAEKWLGLNEYPANEGSGPYQIPFADGLRPQDRMGFTRVQTPRGEGFTISCAECHSANLFGTRVLGMTNRFARANSAFVHGLQVSPFVTPRLFQLAMGATDDETEMYRSSRKAARFIGAKEPVQLGLDTSLAQVALSLAKRASDPWASLLPGASSRDEPLARDVADSKPAVWWNVKYKNRWLSDGSVVSGNPIFTNFLWNEIGRGTDLHELSDWFTANADAVKNLATAVFASQAPRWTDFFDPNSIDLPRAQHGEQLFIQHCSRCHGIYKKAWGLPESATLSPGDRLKTVEVDYPSKTFVVDVGTDPGRYLGMRSLVRLNNLEISKQNGIVIEAQNGYVPPPLVGIWARWPYFHNNSAPSLCAVLTRAENRPKTYWAREADDSARDFDSACNGYPAAPPASAPREWFYDTRSKGLNNSGHDEGIFLKNGQELMSRNDKLDLIQFLQTL